MSQPPHRNGLRLATIGNAIRLETDSLTSEPDASYMYVGLEHKALCSKLSPVNSPLPGKLHTRIGLPLNRHDASGYRSRSS
jgi:hypothetical protein